LRSWLIQWRGIADSGGTADAASCSSGAHLHTFSSPAQSPVKSSPTSTSSMVLTSFLQNRVPVWLNLEDDNQAKQSSFQSGCSATTHAGDLFMSCQDHRCTYDGRLNRRTQLLLWRAQNRTGVFPTQCMPNSVRKPCDRSGAVSDRETAKTV
jgi:hypothetical protein